MQPVLWGVMAAIAVQSLHASPAPGVRGRHLAVTLVLVGCLLPMAAVASNLWPLTGRPARCLVFCVLVDGFGFALGILQPGSMSTLPPSVVVLMAFLILERRAATVLAVVVMGCLTGAAAAGLDGGTDNFLHQVLFGVLLAVVGIVVRQSIINEVAVTVLLAQLEDAREAETEAAALAERTRIAQDLHDVLAHTLSGLAVQIQAARRMARRDQASGDLRGLLDRAGELVKEGVADARRAVRALRGERVPSLERLPELVKRYRVDLELDVTLSVIGPHRELQPDAGEALYRGVQEALTNTVRYARDAQATVTLVYEPTATILTVEDRRTGPGPVRAALVEGSGLGLTGMRERVTGVGGTLHAGPTAHGWEVRMEIPA
ncbi:sensor histidine kinase [Streptomyces canus]|uniref:sensor histidine kinase n=1 Tax=Streptomyces canus TaxID=58343 RepID=UPI002E320A0E|nr:histidine kinase [Streptomyces canus]